MSKVRERVYFGKRIILGVAFFSYQVAFGFSIRYFDRAVMFRLYVLCFKFWGNISCGLLNRWASSVTGHKSP